MPLPESRLMPTKLSTTMKAPNLVGRFGSRSLAEGANYWPQFCLESVEPDNVIRIRMRFENVRSLFFHFFFF